MHVDILCFLEKGPPLTFIEYHKYDRLHGFCHNLAQIEGNHDILSNVNFYHFATSGNQAEGQKIRGQGPGGQKSCHPIVCLCAPAD